MNICLLIISTALFIMLIFQLYKNRKQSRDIFYISEKLHDIIQDKSKEYILVHTSDLSLIKLCNELNNLLDKKNEESKNFIRLESSMKKMLSNISHDLKTPLTVVLGYLEMQRAKYPDDSTLVTVDTKVHEVLTLINQFFELAKLEAGDTIIELSKLNVSSVCRNTILSFHKLLSNEKFKVDIDIPESPVYINGNEDALTRILHNIISNAVKYGDAGKYLALKLWSENGLVKIRITDRGKGIDAKHTKEVFERMYTLEDSRSRSYQGSGLGLTITKELTQHMNGQIELDSIPYVHTSFTITFPKYDTLL